MYEDMHDGTHIETARMIIRDFLPEDAADLYDILGDEETMENCEPAYDFEKTKEFLASFCIGRKGAVAAAHKESGKVVGYVLFRETVEGVWEMGWIYNRSFWRQGYAHEACKAVIDHAFAERNAHKVFAETIDSVKSVGLMQKLGMQPEGVQRSQTRDADGNWADLYFYGLLEEDWRNHGKQGGKEVQIRQVDSDVSKERIARTILEALPEWFGIPEATEGYVADSRGKLFFCACDGEKPVGFLYLKETGRHTAELAVMGVRKEYHRRGIGRNLFEKAKEAARQQGYSFLQVKTVQMGRYDDYDDTNRFYLSLGFKELEVFPTLWDENNPCQVYVMAI